MAARDYRALVPRTPPEGLREWVTDACRTELDRHGLVYEAEYVEEYGLLQMLDEWSRPRKTKMVRVFCSCCGESFLLDWARNETHGYGFVLPEDEEGGWAHTVTAAGDEAACPICGANVLVNKRAAVRKHYIAAQCRVMSAAALEGGELVLTGWTVQRRVYKSGRESLELLPAEAYVFTAADCFQLLGWRNGYSGKCGYFIQYGPWRQPKQWTERWGQEEQIFGLTPALIDRSCLPHCKLDVYMAPRPGGAHYPAAYLRLYQAHPNVEAVLLHGLPRLLDGLIAAKAGADGWKKNMEGRMELPELDWAQTRPAQMLHLTREELRMAQGQCWGRWIWELFVGVKGVGERLTAEEVQAAFCLGDDHLSELIPRRQVGKSIRYLLRQCEAMGAEDEDEDPPPHGIPDAQLLLDYWIMSEALGRDLADPSVRYPADLIAAHDRAAEGMKQKAAEGLAAQFRIRRRMLQKYVFAAHGLLIRPAASQRELTAEGDALHHCVGSYGERHATGKTAIFFIRRLGRPKEPYYTLELDERKLKIQQNRGSLNCPRTPEVEAFEVEWLAWLRVGAPRGRDGKPLPAAVRDRKQGKGAA